MKALHLHSPHQWHQWQEQYLPQVTKIDFVPSSGTPFHASFKLPLGLPGIMQCRFSAGHFIRRHNFGRNNRDAFLLTIEEVGTACYEYGQGRNKVQAGRNEAVLVPNIDFIKVGGANTRFGGLGISILRNEFEARDVRPDDFVMRRLPAQCEALGLLQSYLRSIEKSHGTGTFDAQPALRETALRHIHDLSALAVSWQGTVGESSLGAVAAARKRSALDYIAAHFTDPQLTVARVARHQGISPRYLQRLMESSGHSCIAVVNELRLQKAHEALTGGQGGSILSIAMQSGFSDISHFNRLFRARFGDSPSGVRASDMASLNVGD